MPKNCLLSRGNLFFAYIAKEFFYRIWWRVLAIGFYFINFCSYLSFLMGVGHFLACVQDVECICLLFSCTPKYRIQPNHFSLSKMMKFPQRMVLESYRVAAPWYESTMHTWMFHQQLTGKPLSSWYQVHWLKTWQQDMDFKTQFLNLQGVSEKSNIKNTEINVVHGC